MAVIQSMENRFFLPTTPTARRRRSLAATNVPDRIRKLVLYELPGRAVEEEALALLEGRAAGDWKARGDVLPR